MFRNIFYENVPLVKERERNKRSFDWIKLVKINVNDKRDFTNRTSKFIPAISSFFGRLLAVTSLPPKSFLIDYQLHRKKNL